MARPYWTADEPLPETPPPSTDPRPWRETDVVGERRARIDGYERVSGSAVYPSDVILPGMLHADILGCPHAHARVTAVDTSAAAGMPGVVAVITASSPEADVPWSYGPVQSKLFDPVCRYQGEPVAAVAAETPDQAHDALRAIRVTYEVLPQVSEMERALDATAPAVHEGGNRVSEPETSERGDVDAALAEADVVLEATYTTQCEIHNPMELHGCVARWDGPRLTIWESTQGVYSVQGAVARALRLPLTNVRIIGHYMGGGFGSKLAPGKYTLLAAILARKAARPVKLFLSREQCMLVVGNRPPSRMRIKAGVKKDGTLLALEHEGLGTGGAYPAGGTSLLDWQLRDLYTCPNVRSINTDVYTNAGPARPFRAPGHPQGSWALEQMMDDLAEAIGMDPIELRLRNIPSVSQARGGIPYTTTGLRQCLTEGAKEFGWDEARQRVAAANRDGGHLKRGVGMASCLWIAGGGSPPATVIVKVHADGSVCLNMGASDIGTGTRTIMAMVVAEELGVPVERIQVENADTGTTQFASPSGGSKTVPTESPATRDAARDAARQLLEAASAQLELPVEALELAGGAVRERANPDNTVPLGGLERLQRRRVIVGVGHRGPNPEGKAVNPFAAQLCEVEVNTRTGEVRVLRFLGAHDSGRVMNRLTYDNQVFGGIMMGIGLAMTEERVLDAKQTGKMVNLNLHDYRIPTALDVPPEMTSLPIDPGDLECNTTGAKGLGEPVTIPTAAAVANAVYNATGIRVTATPINPTRLCQMLAEARKEG